MITETQRANKCNRPRLSDLPDVLSMRELIAFLPVGRDAVYALVNSGTIPSIPVGQRRVIVTKAALEAYLGVGVEQPSTPSPWKGE